MKISRQPLLLLLLFEDLVTIPGLFDCNMYKCKDTFPTFIAARMIRSISQFETTMTRNSLAWVDTALLCYQNHGPRFME
jgi:hypothetical protein